MSKRSGSLHVSPSYMVTKASDESAVFWNLPLTKQDVDTHVAVAANDDGDDCDCMSLGIGTVIGVPHASSAHGITTAAPPAEPTAMQVSSEHEMSTRKVGAASSIVGIGIAVGVSAARGNMKPWLLPELFLK